MKSKSTWWKRLGGKHTAPAHARAALGFAGPQGPSLDELLGDATGHGAHRYAPSMVAWVHAQYEAALLEAGDRHTDAEQALEAESQLRVRAADLRHWLVREAGLAFDGAEPLRNGVYFPAEETGAFDQGPVDVTAVYAQQAPDASGEDAPLYGHWTPQAETAAAAAAQNGGTAATREFVQGGVAR